MSKILVDTIDTRSGTSTLTLGSSNAGTIALGSGDVQSNFMYPAFEAKQNSSQSISNDTYTKINFDTERFDTNSTYASSRFTPGVTGKYFIYSSIALTPGNQTDWSYGNISIYKNGSSYADQIFDARGNYVFRALLSISRTLDLNTTDYVEIYGRLTANDGSGTSIQDTDGNCFGGYRIGT